LYIKTKKQKKLTFICKSPNEIQPCVLPIFTHFNLNLPISENVLKSVFDVVQFQKNSECIFNINKCNIAELSCRHKIDDFLKRFTVFRLKKRNRTIIKFDAIKKTVFIYQHSCESYHRIFILFDIFEKFLSTVTFIQTLNVVFIKKVVYNAYVDQIYKLKLPINNYNIYIYNVENNYYQQGLPCFKMLEFVTTKAKLYTHNYKGFSDYQLFIYRIDNRKISQVFIEGDHLKLINSNFQNNSIKELTLYKNPFSKTNNDFFNLKNRPFNCNKCIFHGVHTVAIDVNLFSNVFSIPNEIKKLAPNVKHVTLFNVKNEKQKQMYVSIIKRLFPLHKIVFDNIVYIYKLKKYGK